MIYTQQNHAPLKDLLVTKLLPVFFLCLYSLTGHATDSQIGIASEGFTWLEFDSSGTQILAEIGQRYHLTYQSEESEGLLRQTTRGSLYLGDVNYDGSLQNGTPYTAISGYTGFSVERGWQLQLLQTSVRIYTELNLGLDLWQRQLDKLGGLGYTETYTLLFGRWGYGIHYGGFYGKVGLKMPLYIDEYVDLGLNLKPVPQISNYSELGYRFKHFEFALYADSYRFGQSAPTLYNGVSAWQPTSTMDTIGLRFSLRY